MSINGDSDRHREHLGVSQTKQTKKKKSRRPIDPEDIARSIFSALEHINHDTHLFAVTFGTADPRQYYPNYHRPVGTPSPKGTSPQLSAMSIGDSSSEQSDAMTSTPLLTQCFVHPNVSPSSTATPSATPDDTMFALAPGQKDRLDRVIIKPDGSSWHPAKDVVRALKDYLRRLYTQAYHSWSKIPNSIRQAMFNNFKYWNTSKFKAISEQAKKATGSLKGGSLHTGGAKTIGTITREMEKELGRTSIEPEVFKNTHVRKKENESDPDVWVEERAERTFSGLEGIGSSRQAEALDGVQIAAMSAQIAKLTAALAESEQRRITEQESMSETIQQIKEQVMNLARRPTTSALDNIDDKSDEDDYVEPTP
ncbi:hypothetical protein MTR67_027290 [Solanum verrucosum]|uniref:Uncharacterized protein n=1 Tax=Solanum verrucosum TaxID=315347 RepID=A0AAF0R3W1_SOLVR|nr:hypothetical protein MTR67_027290 [Solanum verrucosum]